MKSAVLGIALLLIAPPVRGQTRFSDANGSIRMVLTGDAIISRRLSVFQEPSFTRMVDLIRDADVAFTNLEVLFHDYGADVAPGVGYRPELAGTYMAAHPTLARELAWAGFDVVSRANNHAADYGDGGLRATDRALEEAGLQHAGTGENLARARAPAYIETPAGRVALISAASTFPDYGRAGPQRKDLRGRPGLNPLRFTTTYMLPAPELEKLRDVRRALGMGAANTAGEEVRFLGSTFVVGERAGIHTRLHEPDQREIVAAVGEAERQANWVIVSVHSHERGATGELPADFLVAFAHEVIDAGADVVVAHGPHRLRGVEMYRDRPIFYSLGNFIFQNETVAYQAADNYETVGLSQDALPADFYDSREQAMGGGWPAERTYWESAVAAVEFRDGRIAEVSFHPITLGHGQRRPQRGRPMLADAALAKKIVEDLQRMSRPFGTQIEFDGTIGRVLLDTARTTPTNRVR